MSDIKILTVRASVLTLLLYPQIITMWTGNVKYYFLLSDYLCIHICLIRFKNISCGSGNSCSEGNSSFIGIIVFLVINWTPSQVVSLGTTGIILRPGFLRW